MSPQAQADFDAEKTRLASRPTQPNQYQDMLKPTRSIPGTFEHVLSRHESVELPWYFNKGVYWLFHLLMFGWVYRVMFACKVKRDTYTLKKVVDRFDPNQSIRLIV